MSGSKDNEINSNGHTKSIVLFDLDGTLTIPRQPIENEMRDLLEELRKFHEIGIVSGSDLKKLCEQLGGSQVLHSFDYVMPENGIIVYKNGSQIFCNSIQKELGDEKLQIFINYVLEYLSKLILPFKRGTFIEFRQGLINICPPGRNCNQEEREDFEKYDKIHHVREKFVEDLKKKFPDLGLVFSIGGQISFDVFPQNWDKSYALQHLKDYNKIYFFGDKTMKGGNDYEIHNHQLTESYTVINPPDTIKQIKKMFNI